MSAEHLAGDVKDQIYGIAGELLLRNALEQIRLLVDGGESGEEEMAAMLLRIGSIADAALSDDFIQKLRK